jgi:hypothetical protein
MFLKRLALGQILLGTERRQMTGTLGVRRAWRWVR